MNIKKNFLLLIIGLLMTFLVPNHAFAGAPTTAWNGLTIAEILTLNSKWGSESYYGLSCESKNNVDGKVNTEWNCTRSSGGKFASHIEIEGSNYHCHFEVTGTGGKTIEKQFSVSSSLTKQAKLDLINSQCGGVVAPTTETCPTLEDLTATIPSYALSDNGNKVTICHLTNSKTNPFNIITISTNALAPHLNNHGDYFTKAGACPTDAVPCPPLVCTLPYVAQNGACVIPDPVCGTDQVITNGACACPSDKFTNTNSCDAKPTCSSTQTYNAVTNVCDDNTPPTTPNPTVKTIDGITYTSPTAVETKNTTPVISGTVGNTVLAAGDSFSVTVNGVSYTSGNANLTASTGSAAWSLTIPEANKLPLGTYEVDAVRNGTHDLTHNEFKVYIDICKNNVDTKKFDLTDLQSNETLGKCDAPVCHDPVLPSDPADCTPPLPPDNEASLPPLPTTQTIEKTVIPNEIQYCDDGTVLSGDVKATEADVSIKRARIANATVLGGTFVADALSYDTATKKGTKVVYGIKTAGSVTITPYTDSVTGKSYTPIVTQGQVTGAKVEGATIENVYVDLLYDYIDPITGEVVSDSNGIKLTGGVTQVSTSTLNGELKASVTSGMIVSGTDANGNPMRGRITSGSFKEPLENTEDVFVKGRRVRGTITGATIVNARITTAKDPTDGVKKTIVDIVDRSASNVNEGIVTAGNMSPTGTLSTFGTVINQNLTGKVLTNTNTCFGSGSVGSRGQLNWKEVVK